MGMPALTNLVKNLIKNKLKGKKGGEQKEETEEPTDCKTHQIKSNAKLVKLSARITALENKPSQESKLFNGDSNPLEDLEERIEKLEKQLKTKGKKK
jgi:archaellum component FlaC